MAFVSTVMENRVTKNAENLTTYATISFLQWTVYHGDGQLCIISQLIQHFVFQLMNTTLKNVELLKHFKIRKLLQHVSVYKETIIWEPQPVLS